MKTLIVKTQAELDALPTSFKEFTIIEIRSGDSGCIKAILRKNSMVTAWDNSTVAAYDNSTVEAWGNSTVAAYDNSKVAAHGNSRVFRKYAILRGDE